MCRNLFSTLKILSLQLQYILLQLYFVCNNDIYIYIHTHTHMKLRHTQ